MKAKSVLYVKTVMRGDNKSLHPIWSVGPSFACCSWGAANAGPPAQTGELNRYVGHQVQP